MLSSKTTRSGRALPTGKTTRRSLSVKRPSVKPLPLHLQCYPQAMVRTPRHPGCTTSVAWTGVALSLERSMANDTVGYAYGRGLSDTPSRCKVVVDGHGTWYHHDPMFALGWKRAAEAVGFCVEVYL